MDGALNLESQWADYPPRGYDTGFALLSVVVNLIVVGVLLLFYPNVRHWSILPILLCGIVIGKDVLGWTFGKLEPFDPKALIALVAYHGFFVAPLFHIAMNTYSSVFFYEGDYRSWFGYMAIVDAIGFMAYLAMQGFLFRRTSATKSYWQIDQERGKPWFSLAIAISLVTFMVLMVKMGGYRGMLGLRQAGGMALLGWMLMLAEPLAALILGAVCAFMIRQRKAIGRMLPYYVLMFCLFVVQFIVAGGRGSRSAVIWGMVVIGGMIHYWVKSFRTRTMIVGIIAVFVFAHIYGYYKSYGALAVEALIGDKEARRIITGGERTFVGTLVGDFGRADVQAFILCSAVTRPTEWDLEWGKTYLCALSLMIPRTIRPKILEGRKQLMFYEVLYGRGRDIPGGPASARVYGLPGEAMLNFPVPAAIIAFAIFGMLIGYYRKKLYSLLDHDARWLLAPFITLLCFMAVFADSDNTVYATKCHMPLFVLVLILSTNKIRFANSIYKRIEGYQRANDAYPE